MKLIFILVACLMPMAGWSQGVWEAPVSANDVKNDVSVKKRIPMPNTLPVPFLK